MFPRSKRFVEPTTGEIPGPGAYDVPIDFPDAPYKKGGMLEKAGRFVEHSGGPDTFGLYDVDGIAASKENKRPRASSSHAPPHPPNPDKVRQQLEEVKHRLQSSHEKELSKLLAKIARLEASRDEMVREKSDSHQEVIKLKAEIRSMSSKETNLASQLAKTESSLSKHKDSIPMLQKKMEELVKSHASSKKRKEIEIESLRTELAQICATQEDRNAKNRTEKTDLLKRLEEQETTLSKMGEQLAQTIDQHVAREKTMSQEIIVERDAKKEISKAAKVMAEERAQAIVKVSQLRQEIQISHLREVRLERQLGDRTTQVEALGEYSALLVEETDLLREELDGVYEHSDWAAAELHQNREERRSEKEWRQRTRSDARENLALREEIEALLEIRQVERELDMLALASADSDLSMTQKEAEFLQGELEIADGELDIAVNEEIPRLEEQLSGAQDEVDIQAEELESLHADFELVEAELDNVQTQANFERESLNGQLEEIRRRLTDRERECEKEKIEKKRVLNILGQTRLSESALREELEAAQETLSRLQGVRSQHNDLCRTIDELARRNAAAEQDVQALEEMNTDLISHGNPNQRIKHMAQIRTELAESRRSHLSTAASLAAAQQEKAELLAELNAYRAVSSNASTASLGPFAVIPTRSRVARPDLDDVLPPHEVLYQREVILGETNMNRIDTTQGQSKGRSSMKQSNMNRSGPRRAGRVNFDENGTMIVNEVYGAASAGITQKTVTTSTTQLQPTGGVRQVGRLSLSDLI